MPKTVKVAEVTELEPGEGKTVEVEGFSLALFNVDGTYFAIANTCTHVGGPLGEGALIGKEVTCPLHGAQFDVTCGKALSGPARGDATSFPVSLEGNDVLVEMEQQRSNCVPIGNAPQGRHKAGAMNELEMRQLYAELQPGDRVEVIHHIKIGSSANLDSRTIETVMKKERRQCGIDSGFARNWDDKYQFDHLVLGKDDGELTSLTMDEYTQLKRLEPLSTQDTD